MTTDHRDETVRIAALTVSPEPGLVVCLEPDELQGLRAITEVEAAGSGREADLTQSAKTLIHAALEARLEELGLRWNPSPETVRTRAALTTRPAGPVIALMTNDRARKLAVSGLAVAALIVLWGGYIQGWRWTGFQGNEQLWDWLHLLLLPVVAGTLPLWIQHPEYMTRTRRLMYVTAAAAFTGLVLVPRSPSAMRQPARRSLTGANTPILRNPRNRQASAKDPRGVRPRISGRDLPVTPMLIHGSGFCRVGQVPLRSPHLPYGFSASVIRRGEQ